MVPDFFILAESTEYGSTPLGSSFAIRKKFVLDDPSCLLPLFSSNVSGVLGVRDEILIVWEYQTRGR